MKPSQEIFTDSMIRIAETYKITVNDEPVEIEFENGYAEIERRWEKGDQIDVELPMPVRIVVADERITDDRGKIAVQRGPLIYCAEWPDNNQGNVLNLLINKDTPFTTEFIPSLLKWHTGYQDYRLPD